jgi:putative oxidoreductase
MPLTYVPYFALILRIWLGANLMSHGYPLLFSPKGKADADRMASQGIPKGVSYASMVLLFFGGIFLIVGLIVPIVGLLFAILFTGIIVRNKFKLHQVYIGGPAKPSYEPQITYLMLSIAIIALGAGAFSLDALIGI